MDYLEELSIDCRIITVKPVFKEQDGDVDWIYLFIYLSMLHYLCNTTYYNYLHLIFYTLYTYVILFVCWPYLHYTSCTLYTYVLSPLYHPAVIVRNLLIQ